MSRRALTELEQSLREQLRLSEGELIKLEEDLKSVDDELVVLRREQDKYDKLALPQAKHKYAIVCAGCGPRVPMAEEALIALVEPTGAGAWKMRCAITLAPEGLAIARYGRP